LKQQFMDKSEIIQSSGELQYEVFEPTKEDIKGQFMFDFDVDNMTAIDETQNNNINNLLQILAGNEVLQPVLRQLNPFKTGRILFKKNNLTYEDFIDEGEGQVLFLSPEKENKLYAEGQTVEAKRGEPHQTHIDSHTAFVKLKINEIGPEQAQLDPVVNKMIEHIVGHQQLQQEEGQVTQSAPPAQQGPGPEGPEGPQGPLQGTPQ